MSRRLEFRGIAAKPVVRRLAWRAGALACAGLLASCSRHAAPAAKAPVLPVLVARAATMNVPVTVGAIGTVEAYSTVSIRSQITGPILRQHFQEGREVRAGDLLFTVDPRPYEAALNQARANLKRDEAQLINARLAFERTSNLFAGKIAAQQDFDSAQAAYQSAQAMVMADGAALTNAQIALGYTQIRSPINGRTGSVNFKEGNVVKSPDDVLVTITQDRPIYVAFAVPEEDLPEIRRRSAHSALQVQAVVGEDTNHPATGELTFINNAVDTNTGTILLKGTFPNTNHFLWPGQFVQVSLTLSNLVGAVVVPTQALQTGQNGEYLFVVKPDSTVEARTNIVAGVSHGGQTVILKGLKPGEIVVTDGQLRLAPGARVSMK